MKKLVKRAVHMVAFGVAGFIGSSLSHAQMRGGGGRPVFLGNSLDKVPVGTWAEYATSRGDRPARKMRQALVGKEGPAFVIEMATEGPGKIHTVWRLVVGTDPTKEGSSEKVIMQIGTADPMEMPPSAEDGGGVQSANFMKIDRSTLLGKESIKVAAGTFQTEHYRMKGPRGGNIDVWTSAKAGAFTLVKMELERPAGQQGGPEGKVTMELTAMGKDAKPEVTKAPKPYDAESFRSLFGTGPRGNPSIPTGPLVPAKPAAPAAPH